MTVNRFRIDFSVNELDAPENEQRRIVFGEEVTAEDIFDFFNRCRDGVVTLLTGKRPVEREVAPERYYPGVHLQPRCSRNTSTVTNKRSTTLGITTMWPGRRKAWAINP